MIYTETPRKVLTTVGCAPAPSHQLQEAGITKSPNAGMPRGNGQATQRTGGGHAAASPVVRLRSVVSAFLAAARAAAVDADQWDSLSAVVLRMALDEPDELITSGYEALYINRAVVAAADWPRFASTLDELLRVAGRGALADRVAAVTTDRVSSGTGSVRKRPRSPCVEHPPASSSAAAVASSSRDKRRGRGTGTAGPVATDDAFHLLATDGVPTRSEYETVTLQDVVAAGAELAVIINFKYDFEWMWQAAPALATFAKTIIVHGHDESDMEEGPTRWRKVLRQIVDEGQAERVKFVRPTTPAYGTVHAKVFVLFYATGCRVCVHTANMLQSDWEKKTQGAYMRDFPRRVIDVDAGATPTSSMRNGGDTYDGAGGDEFGAELSEFLLRCLERGDEADRLDVLKRVAMHDFRSAGAALVASVPGRHEGRDRWRFGHARLRTVLERECGAVVGRDSVAVAQFSSLGSTQARWLENEFCATLFAQEGEVESGVGDGARQFGEMKLVFPTVEQVRGSSEGMVGGSSLPVSGRNMQRAHVTSRLHVWDASCSGRERALPHIKTLVRYRRPLAGAGVDEVLWAFVGSQNLSVAAWGRMQGARKGCSWTKLHVLSYELGVLVSRSTACLPVFGLPDATVKYSMPVCAGLPAAWDKARRRGGVVLRIAHGAKDGASSGDSGEPVLWVPLPYALPPRRYIDGDVPWTVEQCQMV